MPFFTVTRSRPTTEVILVKADSEAEARANVDSGKKLTVNTGKPEEPTLVEPFDMVPEEGEKMFEVEVDETHIQVSLITAKTKEEAKERVTEGEGYQLHNTSYRETSDSTDWTVREFEG